MSLNNDLCHIGIFEVQNTIAISGIWAYSIVDDCRDPSNT